MPYSRRSRFRHDERRSPRGFVRIRTVTTRTGKEIRVGYRRDGSSAVVSVLTPKSGTTAVGRSRALRDMRADMLERRFENLYTTNEHVRGAPLAGHAHSHAHPEHHVGPCDAACRRALRPHLHRRRMR